MNWSRSKRQGQRTEIDGIKYRSTFEARVGEDLRSLEPLAAYEPFQLPYTLEKSYTPDFLLPNNIVVEAKGYFPSAERTKLLAVIAANPLYDIRIIFQNPQNRLYKGSKTTYAEWADKHGIKWAEKRVPREWLEEDRYALEHADLD